jgi:serine/threonine protein kinase/TolB-like protein/tetratricopeptide (TPR) repeat protein
MTEARWEQVKALFEAAVDRPPSERDAFLSLAAAADEDLRREVQSLLRSDDPDAELTGLLQRQDASVWSVAGVATLQNSIGPYQVLGLLGSGGMGDVFRARDSKLNRDVALKLLPRAFELDADRLARFRREARALAALNHPHIAAIYGLEESDGRQALVLELVEGITLAERIAAGPLPVLEALGLARQIAEALEAAHQKGIIHRDLKPANIKVTPAGDVKVLDFGLAKTAAAEAAAPEITRSSQISDGGTRVGAVLGTAAYMSPEQSRGLEVDSRTDVWAFGCVLFEMLSGGKAFAADTDSDSTDKVLAREPDWTALPARTPARIRELLRRCLEKDPAKRPQTIAETRQLLDRQLTSGGLSRRTATAALAIALLAIAAAVVVTILLVDGRNSVPSASASPATSPTTVAVLPLANATGDPSLDYYADGLTDALLADAGRLDGIRLISRTSARRAAASGQSTAAIAKSLRAGAIVTGAVRLAGERVRVDLQLTDAATGSAMWSRQFDRSAREILVLQADVVRALADGVQVTIQPLTRQRLTTVRAVSPDVSEAYLKGRYYWNQRTPESIAQAIEHFLRAVRLDPTYAPAYAALADCYNQQATLMVGIGAPQEYRSKAAAAALRALQIDPASSESHAALGYIRHYEWRWQEAEQEFLRAIELNPSNSLARAWYGNMLMSQMRLDDALWQVRLARELDPFSSVINANVGWVLVYARRPQEAIEQLTRTLEIDPQYAQARWRLIKALLLAGRTSEAVTEAERVVESGNRSPAALSILAVAAAHDGRTARAHTLLDMLLDLSRRDYVPAGTIADIYVALGDRQRAFEWMEKAYDERSNWVAYIAGDPANDQLRDEPYFQSLLKRVGLSPRRDAP